MGRKGSCLHAPLHFYTSGASIYTTYVFRIPPKTKDTLTRWQRLKSRASQVIVKHGGTISHQHGVGSDHAPYLIHEKKPLGIDTLKRVFDELDPEQIMNPGKLVDWHRSVPSIDACQSHAGPNLSA